MNDVLSFLVAPFSDYVFMKRALIAAIALAVSGAPLGLFMTLRRMTLAGDALSHGILPGVALAFLFSGLSLWPLTAGGMLAAATMAGLTALLTRFTALKEETAFAFLSLLALASGVALISSQGSLPLMHVLFGNILAIDRQTLALATGVCITTLLSVAVFYRRFVIDGFDGAFMRTAGTTRRFAASTSLVFFMLLMLNLVAAFQALGTLMALGLMILPALSARFWSKNIDILVPTAMALGALCAYVGLLASYHAAMPSGPAIVLVAGIGVTLSALFGRVGSVRAFLQGGYQS